MKTGFIILEIQNAFLEFQLQLNPSGMTCFSAVLKLNNNIETFLFLNKTTMEKKNYRIITI